MQLIQHFLRRRWNYITRKKKEKNRQLINRKCRIVKWKGSPFNPFYHKTLCINAFRNIFILCLRDCLLRTKKRPTFRPWPPTPHRDLMKNSARVSPRNIPFAKRECKGCELAKQRNMKSVWQKLCAQTGMCFHFVCREMWFQVICKVTHFGFISNLRSFCFVWRRV